MVYTGTVPGAENIGVPDSLRDNGYDGENGGTHLVGKQYTLPPAPKGALHFLTCHCDFGNLY